MRKILPLQTGWFISPSSHDALLAASGSAYSPNDLALPDDPENHPREIELPGGPQYGKRPLQNTEKGESRLPASFLSYARQVEIPAEYADHRIWLHLDKVRYHVTVTVNGTVIDTYRGGWEPHSYDITDHVTPGEAAMLLITVGDTGVSGHHEFDPYNYTGTRLPTCKEIQDNLIHPVAYGGADRAVGQVSLEAVPPLRTSWVFANPKVSRGVLELTLHLVNDTPIERTIQLSSEARGSNDPNTHIKALIKREIRIAPHSSLDVKEEVSWPDAVLWDTDNPHLYDIVTTLSDGETVLDVHQDYFGFREFTINGHSFFLNGKKIHLLGSSGHITPAQDKWSLEEKIAFFRKWKEKGNVNHVRLHARPKDKGWVLAADRTGMLIATETALWTTGFYSFDWAGSEEACYQNVRKHFMDALVRRDRNNPSVVIWSLSNEMSPITEYDMANPKMAAMTRAFEKIIAEAEDEDDSRVIQMSSAMDFVGRLKMLNLHYPKSWQAFPDYPHTAYWMEEGFRFPWYGIGREHMPSWSWKRDKPLYIGEFSCIFGPTPDSQACIVGDVAFEDADAGNARIHEKLWPLEINAYRRHDVSGFCAWAAMFPDDYAVDEYLESPSIKAHSHALRPLAVLDHSFQTIYFAEDEISIPLSLHNDSRHARELSVVCTVQCGGETLWAETMPPALYQPGESKSWTCRFLSPKTNQHKNLTFHVKLVSAGQTLDEWSKQLEVFPRQAAQTLPAGTAFYDPEGKLQHLCKERGIAGGTFLRGEMSANDLHDVKTLWLNFETVKLRADDWEAMQPVVQSWVENGGCVVLDHAPSAVCTKLPVPIKDGKGYAAGDNLEITYAYNLAPCHVVTSQLTDTDFSLWGTDGYVAHRCFEVPQAGNVIPLLAVGADLSGLTISPLLEIRSGQGRYRLSSLELWEKLWDEPRVSSLIIRLAQPGETVEVRQTAVCVSQESLQRLEEVGLRSPQVNFPEVLQADFSLVDGCCLPANVWDDLREPLNSGKTVYLHDLTQSQTAELLQALDLPGEVNSKADGHDLVRHDHPLCDGMTNNYIYWTVDKAKLAAWSSARLHPHAVSAVINAPQNSKIHPFTRDGAVTAYEMGKGLLIVDNLRWQLTNLDEPQRPRRYLMCLLTNLGVKLHAGGENAEVLEFESEEERRERGHF